MKDFLENLLKNDITPLENFIINDILNTEESSEDIYDYMVNVVSIGGEQGVIISLIYGKDTEEFCKNFLDEILEMLDDFCKNILLSETMALNFKKLMQYYKETGGNPHDLLAPFIKEYALPVKSKKEGKIIYELIRNQILG